MERRGKRGFYRRHERVILGISGIVLVLIAWQMSVQYGLVSPQFSSSPALVAQVGYDYVQTAQFRADIYATTRAFSIGLFFAIVIGTTTGLLMGWFKRLNYLLDYVISFAYSAPRIALIPLLIIWFGIGSKASEALVFLMAFFPIMVNTLDGVRTVDPQFVEMSRSFNSSNLRLFLTVLLPGAVPSIMSGVRLAVGIGLTGVIVSEFTASTEGMGYMMANAAANFRTSQVFAGLVIMSTLGVVLTEVARWLERHFDRWRPRRV